MSYSASNVLWTGFSQRYGSIRLQRLSGPANEPVTLADAKLYLAIYDTDWDTYLTTYAIPEARRWVETYTRRALITQQWRLTADRFPEASAGNPRADIMLPFGRCQSVEQIAYVATDLTTQTLTGPTSGSPAGTDYQEDLSDDYGGILRAPRNAVWPAVADVLGAVQVTFTVGYGSTGAAVDWGLMSATKFMMANLFETRNEQDARYSADNKGLTAERLADPYVIRTF